MRRSIFILLLGLAAAAVGYCCVYLLGSATARALRRSPQPELAWLKQEFNLGDSEFARIAELHMGYLPLCRERCQRIAEQSEVISQRLAAAVEVTPEIEHLLSERAKLRATCQAEMLRHFFKVSRSMPPEQGRRYLAWVHENTCVREQSMEHSIEDRAAAMAPGHPR